MKYIKLFEASYSKKNIPDFFYRSLDIKGLFTKLSNNFKIKNTDLVKALNVGQLTNIEGVSANEIAFVAAGHKSAFLKFKGSDFEKINSISKILYDNHLYMTDNNFLKLDRVSDNNFINYYSANGVRSRFLDFDSTVLKNEFSEKLLKTFPNKGFNITVFPKDAIDVIDYMEYLPNAQKIFKSFGTHTKNFQSAVAKLSKYFNTKTTISCNISIATYVIYTLVTGTSGIFKDEYEWVIKDKKINIPKSTILYLLAPKLNLKILKMLQEKIHFIKIKIITNLDEIY